MDIPASELSHLNVGRVTVILKNPHRCEIYQRKHSGRSDSHVKACSDQADGKVEKDTVTFYEEKGEDTLVRRP